VIGVGLVAAAVLVGSDLADLYRFDQYMSASAKEYATPLALGRT